MYSLPCLIFLLLPHLNYLQGRPSPAVETKDSLIFQASKNNSTGQEEKEAWKELSSKQALPSEAFPERRPFSLTTRIISGVTQDSLIRDSIPLQMQPRKLDFDWPAHGRNDIQTFPFQPVSETLYQGQDDNSDIENQRYEQQHLSGGNGQDQTHNGMKPSLTSDSNPVDRPTIVEENEMLSEDSSTWNFSHHQEKHAVEEHHPPTGDITNEWGRDNGRLERLSLNHLNVSRVTGNTNVSVIHFRSSTSIDNSTLSIAALPSPHQDAMTTAGESSRVALISGIAPIVGEGEGSFSSPSLVYLNQGQGHSNDIDYDKKEVGQDDQLNASKTMNRPETFTTEIQATTPFSLLYGLINKLVLSSLTPVSSVSSPSHVQQDESITENQVLFESLLNSIFEGSGPPYNDNITDSSINQPSHLVPGNSSLVDTISEDVIWETPEQNKDPAEPPIPNESWGKEKQKTSLTYGGLEVPTKNGIPSNSLVLPETYYYDETDVTDISDDDDEDFEISRSGILGPGPAVAVIAAGIGIALYVYGRTWRYVIPNEFALTSTLPPLTTAKPTSAPSSRTFSDPWIPSYYLPAPVIPRPDLEFDDEVLYRNPSTYIKYRKPTSQAKTTYENLLSPFPFLSGLWR
ncbi:unnamed protein product [Allacma fusca]|uniref:Uncharacterized protein n=1 Tax=Allacma fusca TaxID=39272 RepID=A0A8J2K5N3_9HEXA|nr:unnamed protein product [Allacma fusca]